MDARWERDLLSPELVQLAAVALAGLAVGWGVYAVVMPYLSGERQADAGLIEAGNPQLRAVLIELAHRLTRQVTGPWSSLARRLLLKGKKKNVVVAAVANRFVRWLYHQMQPGMLAQKEQAV